MYTTPVPTTTRLLLIAALALVGVAGIACDDDSGDFPEVDCSTVEVKGYSEMTVWASCTTCHASSLSGSSRQSAPSGVDFDTYEAAMSDPEEAASEVAKDAMPPGGGLSQAAKDELYAWVRCGMPQ